jgi:uncharacterized short protein YbdD (DUF466 family)
MAITDISISEELMTDAPSIKYRGDEGPKSPEQERMRMVDEVLDEAYEQYIYDLLEQRPDATPMSKEEFRRMVIMEGMLGGGNPLPPDPTEPVNPFKPKPIGPVLPDKREMAAFGGIMGVDGRRQYGIGSFFQKYIKDPIEMYVTGKTFEDLEKESQDRVDKEDELYGKGYEGVIDRLLKGEKKKDDKGREYREGGAQDYILPVIGGLTAGLFTKKNQDGSPGGQPTADETALMLADLKKSANILDQQQGLAAGLNFLPDVAARKFTPAQMIETYKTTAANGGRIGFNQGLLVPENEMTEKTNQMILDMHKRGMDVDTISTITEKDVAYVNSIISAQNQKAEGGLMDLSGRIGYAGGGGGTQFQLPFGKPDYFTGSGKNRRGIYIQPDGTRLVVPIGSDDLPSYAQGGRVPAQEGGIMDLGGLEKDYRNTGGFVEIGAKEKADDVPARLSVNEFVFTADAVRNAGGGDIDEGAKVMENVMKHLEGGGQLSRESQGMGGARDMFAVSERLSEVV